MTRAFARNILERKRKERREIKKVPASDITHKSIAMLSIVSHVRKKEEGRGKSETQRFRFSLQIRLGERNDPRLAGWNFNGDSIIFDVEKRARSINGEKEG